MIRFAKKDFFAGQISKRAIFAQWTRAKSNSSGNSTSFFSNAALHWVDDHQAILRGAAFRFENRGD